MSADGVFVWQRLLHIVTCSFLGVIYQLSYILTCIYLLKTYSRICQISFRDLKQSTRLVLRMSLTRKGSTRTPLCFQVHYLPWQTSSVRLSSVKSFSVDLRQFAEGLPVHSQYTSFLKYKHSDNIKFDMQVSVHTRDYHYFVSTVWVCVHVAHHIISLMLQPSNAGWQTNTEPRYLASH